MVQHNYQELHHVVFQENLQNFQNTSGWLFLVVKKLIKYLKAIQTQTGEVKRLYWRSWSLLWENIFEIVLLLTWNAFSLYGPYQNTEIKTMRLTSEKVKTNKIRMPQTNTELIYHLFFSKHGNHITTRVSPSVIFMSVQTTFNADEYIWKLFIIVNNWYKSVC